MIEGVERQAPSEDAPQGGGAGFGMNAYRAKPVARRDDQLVEQLLTEFLRNRAQMIDAARAAEEKLLTQPTRSAGGVEGTLLAVLDDAAVGHVRKQADDLLSNTNEL